MNLAQFLVEAKKKTYASEEANKKINEDGSNELLFRKDNLIYKDKYYGADPFIGEEVVLEDNKVIWVMNYYGEVISSDADVKNVYAFLKKAMSQVNEDKPFRGPAEYTEGDYKYLNSNEGDINNFSGSEKIFYKNKNVYKLIYHGCSVK